MFCLTSAIELVRVKIWCVYGKALGMRMQKLVLGLSLAQILSEKMKKIFLTKKLGFIDVLQTVFWPDIKPFFESVLVRAANYFLLDKAHEYTCSLGVKVYLETLLKECGIKSIHWSRYFTHLWVNWTLGILYTLWYKAHKKFIINKRYRKNDATFEWMIQSVWSFYDGPRTHSYRCINFPCLPYIPFSYIFQKYCL